MHHPATTEAPRGDSPGDAAPRQRLLHSGLRLFATQGFAKTSTRELAEAAGVNIAAISYYFGDKAGLYRAAFAEPGDGLGEDLAHLSDPGVSLPQALARLYACFLAPLKQGDLARLCMKLHLREMLEPTGLRQVDIAHSIQPMHDALLTLLGRHFGLARPDDDLVRLAISLCGLGVHLHVGHEVINSLAPQLNDGADALDLWSERLVMYALAMIGAEQQRRATATTEGWIDMKRMLSRRRLAMAMAGGLLGGCSAFAPPVTMPPDTLPAAHAPTAWQAPLPAAASPQQTSLRLWWQQFNDPVLLALLDSAQAASPTIAAAASRIEQARATRTASAAVLLPALNADARATTGRSDLNLPVAAFASANLQASWELDLFGANAAARDAAQARFEGSQAGWHDARISVAAETASTYNALRGCEALVVQTDADVSSRNETARVTELAAKSGLVAPASAALARASAAQGRSLLTQQRAQCELLVKSLVALTAVDETLLRQQLAPGTARLPEPNTIGVDQVPAQALMQRPDLLNAEAQILAAADDTTQAQALRYPRVSIAGSVGPALLRVQNSSISGNLWTIGPVQVSMPLFDGGALAANVVAARARYDEAVAVYRAAVRSAVREVESALVSLDATARRSQDAQLAAEGFEVSLRAADARFKGGLGSLFDLEEARRSALVANSTLVELQRDRVSAWISLYRALGGGWSAGDLRLSSGAAAEPPTVAALRPAP